LWPLPPGRHGTSSSDVLPPCWTRFRLRLAPRYEGHFPTTSFLNYAGIDFLSRRLIPFSARTLIPLFFPHSWCVGSPFPLCLKPRFRRQETLLLPPCNRVSSLFLHRRPSRGARLGFKPFFVRRPPLLVRKFAVCSSLLFFFRENPFGVPALSCSLFLGLLQFFGSALLWANSRW